MKTDWNDLSGRLEVRFTGLPKVVATASGFWSQGDGELNEREIITATGFTNFERQTDRDRREHTYAAGLKLYPMRALHVAGEYYRKVRETDYIHPVDPTSNDRGKRFPAFLTANDFTTDDYNIRVTLRPAPNLTIAGRYDYQTSTIDTAFDGLATLETGDVKTRIFSATATFSPIPRLYLQGYLNKVEDERLTAEETLSGGVADLVIATTNDYWSAGVSAGLAVNDATDLSATYFHYESDNYFDNSGASVPYGSSSEENDFSVSVTRRFSDNLRVILKYGFFRNRDEAIGGLNNYDAHLVYASGQYRF